METFEKSKVFIIRNEIDYSKDAVVSKIVTKQPSGNITLFAFDKEQGLSEHSAPFDALVEVVEGKAEIIIDKRSFVLSDGESIIMPANIPHAVRATERFKMLLTMIKG